MKDSYLDLDNCITLHDVEQIKKELIHPKIKTINKLTRLLLKKKLIEGSVSSVYSKLYRYEKEGFNKEDNSNLIKAILKVLDVEEKDLVKEMVA